MKTKGENTHIYMSFKHQKKNNELHISERCSRKQRWLLNNFKTNWIKYDYKLNCCCR